MNSESQALENNQIQPLWRKLTHELLNIFDAHGICSVVANEVALFTQTTTIVGISDPHRKYYDVWICDAEGSIQQTRWENKKSSFDKLIDAGCVVMQEKFTVQPNELVKSELWRLPKEGILSVPLPTAARYTAVTPPGIICFIDPKTNSPINADNINDLAMQVTMALDRAYLRQQNDRQEIEFAVVSDISHALTSTLSLQNIYMQLMEPVRRTLNVGSISVGLLEPASGDIYFVDMLMGDLFANIPTIRLKSGEGIAGWVVENGQPVIVNDVYRDKRFYAGVDRTSGFLTESMACIPLRVEEKVIGVMQAINKKNGEFNENDLRLLQAIGGPLAASIENAQLHTEVLSEKRRIETIFTSMSEGTVTINSEGQITQANEAMISLLFNEPTAQENLIGKAANKAIQLKSGSLNDFIERVKNDEDEYPQLATDLYPQQGAPVPVLLSGAPILNADNKFTEMIFVFSDLRQIREVERMRDDFFHASSMNYAPHWLRF